MNDTKSLEVLARSLERGIAKLPPPLIEIATRRRDEFLEKLRVSQDGADLLGRAGDAWVAQAPRVWAASDFVARHTAGDPALLRELVAAGDLERPVDPGDLAARVAAAVVDGEEPGSRLRRRRRREMVLIAWRDLAGEADLAEVVRATTALADACIAAGLAAAEASLAVRYGRPVGARSARATRMVVLGLGKLGGRELNFSSDVDLMFAYEEDGETDGPRSISNHEFFVRVGRALIGLLDESTDQGFVFRVDMRLRPNGDSGPLALSFDAMEHYYQTHGRDWERYALVKARVVAGDVAAGARLLETLSPFVYRKYLDYGAFDSIRSMKGLIAGELERKGRVDHLKLGRGGIREAEFLVQSFQLIRGGREPRLRTPSFTLALAVLEELGLVTTADAAALREAYERLRTVENRLQMVDDQQVHHLPGDELARERLGLAHGGWARLSGAIDAAREAVHACFSRILDPEGGETSPAERDARDAWAEITGEGDSGGALAALGFGDPGECARRLAAMRRGGSYRAFSKTGRERLDRLMPLVIQTSATEAEPDLALARVLSVIEAIGRRSAYLALLYENPIALTQLVRLCAASPWIAGWVGRHPLMLDELLGPLGDYRPGRRYALEEELARRVGGGEPDLEAAMETLREWRNGATLRVAAASLRGGLDVESVGQELSLIAEVLLGQTVVLGQEGLAPRFGRPAIERDGTEAEPEFAVVAYGKLGGRELGYHSDLDIIFLYETPELVGTGTPGGGVTRGGDRSIANEYYFGRLGQRIVHLITTRTAAGLLYELDTRLRPSGRSGTLVSSLAGFEAYQLNQAWTWEHQALVRARVVVGSTGFRARFESVRDRVLRLRRDPAALARDVDEMRTRMIETNATDRQGVFDIKHARGGIVDIEFIVQYLVLLHARDAPRLIEPRGNLDALAALADTGCVDAERARDLARAYRRYLEVEHRLKLMEKPSLVEAGELDAERSTVSAIWHDTFDADER